MAKYTVQWQTTTTHQATIEADSDSQLFRSFGFHTYDDEKVTGEDYINGSFKIVTIESEVSNG